MYLITLIFDDLNYMYFSPISQSGYILPFFEVEEPLNCSALSVPHLFLPTPLDRGGDVPRS